MTTRTTAATWILGLALLAIHTCCYAGNTSSNIPNLDDYAMQHCNVLIGYLSGIPMWRDEEVVPISRAENTIGEIILEDPPSDPYLTQEEVSAWRGVVASTPSDMAQWNSAVMGIYNSKITSAQIRRALRRYCTPYTRHVFSAHDLDAVLKLHGKR